MKFLFAVLVTLCLAQAAPSSEISKRYAYSIPTIDDLKQYDYKVYELVTEEYMTEYEEFVDGAEAVIELLDPETFNLTELSAAYLSFLGSPMFEVLPAAFASKFIPEVTNEYNLQLIESLLETDFPNYNTRIDSVAGLDDGRLTWIVEAENRTMDDPVVLYSHGGAYVLGNFPMFTYMLTRLYIAVDNDRVSIAILDYSLGEYDMFPQALSDIVANYNHLAQLSDNIILGGDSAGGHLTLSFLRHKSYEQVSGVPEASKLDPSGLFLFSPWLNLYPANDTGTHASNYGKDILISTFLQDCTEAYLPDPDMYTAPALNPYKDAIDWDAFIPSSVFVTEGEDEILRDDISAWAELAGLDDDELYPVSGGVHDSVVFVPSDSSVINATVQYFHSLGY